MSGAKPVELPAPRGWFQHDPNSGRQPTVAPDGRVGGYIAIWPPNNGGLIKAGGTDYTRFHSIAGRTADGAVIQVGRLTSLEDEQTVGHVVVGEDTRGAWVAGVLHPAADIQLPTGTAWGFSGDWRGASLAAVVVAKVSGGFWPVKAVLR